MHATKREAAGPGSAAQTETDARAAGGPDAWRRGETFYHTLVATSPYAVTVTDLEGTITYTSERTCALYGCARSDELVGKSAFELIAPEDRERALHNMQRTLTEGRIEQVEYRLQRADGSRYWGEMSASVVRGDDGQPVAFIATTADISHLKETERALRDSEARFRDLAELAPQIIFEVDAEGRVRFASRVGLERLGFDPARFADGQRHISDVVAPEDQERSRANVQRILLEHLTTHNEYTLVNDRGERVPVAIHSAPIMQHGRAVGLRGMVVDISARRHAEQELQRLNRELEQRVAERTAQLEAANRELESFSSSVSHDLRSPLATIEGFGRALLEDCGEALGAEGRAHVGRLLAAGARMGQLIDDLLRLARLTSGELRREQVDLSQLAQLVAARLCRPTAGRELQVTVQPGLAALADERLVQVLLENLLSNACKFTADEARADVQVGALDPDDRRFARGPGQTIFFVRDNGVGFDAARAQGLFQPFRRFHRDDEFPGTGIGLATVQRVAARHGGRAWIESAPGEGATVYFTLSS